MRKNTKKRYNKVLLTLIIALVLVGCSLKNNELVETTPIDPIKTEDVSTTTEPTETEPVETEEILKLTDEEIATAIDLAEPVIKIMFFGKDQLNYLKTNEEMPIYMMFPMVFRRKTGSMYPYFDEFNYEYNENGELIRVIYKKEIIDKMFWELFGKETDEIYELVSANLEQGLFTYEDNYYDELNEEYHIGHSLERRCDELSDINVNSITHINEKGIDIIIVNCRDYDGPNVKVYYQIMKNEEDILFLRFIKSEKE